jgi:hypothetical protein
VTFTVSVPDGWTAAARTPVSFAGVPSGRTVTASWQVTLPPDAGPGQEPVQVQAVYTADGQRGVTHQTIDVLSVYATLAAAFNNTGISDDSDLSEADFDGVGNSYSAQALAAAGLTPGATITHEGLTFTWPDAQPGQPDNVVAEGQTILLSGSGTTLGIIGAGGPSESGTGTVYYTDGTASASASRWTTTSIRPRTTTSSPRCPISTTPTPPRPATMASQASARRPCTCSTHPRRSRRARRSRASSCRREARSRPAAGISGMHIFALAVGPLSATGAPLTGPAS